MGWFNWFKSKEVDEIIIEERQQAESTPSIFSIKDADIVRDIKASLDFLIHKTTYPLHDDVGAVRSIVMSVNIDVVGFDMPRFLCRITPLVSIDEAHPPKPTFTINKDGVCVITDLNKHWQYLSYVSSTVCGAVFPVHHLYGLDHETVDYSDKYRQTGIYSNQYRQCSREVVSAVLDPVRLGIVTELENFFKEMEIRLVKPYQLLKEIIAEESGINRLIKIAEESVDTVGAIAGKEHEATYLPTLRNDNILVFGGVTLIRDQITGWRYIPGMSEGVLAYVDIFVLGRPVSIVLNPGELPGIRSHLYVANRLRWFELPGTHGVDEDHPAEEILSAWTRRYKGNPYGEIDLPENIDREGINKAIDDGIEAHYLHHHGKSYLEVLKDTFDKVLLTNNTKQ